MQYVHYKYWNIHCEATKWVEEGILLPDYNTISNILALLSENHSAEERWGEHKPAEIIILNIIKDD